MVSYTITEVVMYDEVMYEQGGIVRRWFEGIETELTEATREEAPLNRRPNKNPSQGMVGDLKAGISGEVTQTGERDLEAVVTSEAPYTMYVVGGTQDNIYARDHLGQFGFRAEGFPLPPQPWVQAKRVQRISGQDPNDFFLRAYEIVSSHHEALG